MTSQLGQYIKAAYPLIYLTTHEESRALNLLADLAKMGPTSPGYDLYVWSVTKGFRLWDSRENNFLTLEDARKLSLAVEVTDACVGDPHNALQIIEEYPNHGNTGQQPKAALPRQALFVLLDMHVWLNDTRIVRQLRDAVEATLESNQVQSTILLSPQSRIPQELEKSVVVVDLPLPDGQLLEQTFATQLHELARGGSDIVLDEKTRADIVKAAAGLTLDEAKNAFRKGLLASGFKGDATLVGSIKEERRQLVQKGSLLDYLTPTETFEQVAGLEALKAWIQERVGNFSPEARAYGLPSARGILLAGIPGCGTSLITRAAANELGLPLLRLDVGRLVSNPAADLDLQVRDILKVVESMAPVLLWLYEVDNGFTHEGGGNRAQHSETRTWRQLRTWMQEHASAVFVVATTSTPLTIATSGEVKETLPQALRQKGPFDEAFFIGLPDVKERRRVWQLQLRQRRLDPGAYELDDLVAKSEGWSSSQITLALTDALHHAFNKKGAGPKKQMSAEDLAFAMRNVRPYAEKDDVRFKAVLLHLSKKMRSASVGPDVTVPIENDPYVTTAKN